MARVLLDTNRGFSRRVFEVDEVFVGQLERALELLPPGDSQARVLTTAALVRELQYSNDPDRLMTLSADAVDIARRTGDQEALIAALSTRFSVFNLPDRLALAAPLIAELEPMVTDAVTVKVRAGYAGAIVGLAGWSGDRARFNTGIAMYAAIADSLPPSARWLSAAARAGYELRFGDLDTAAALSEDLLRQAGETGEPDALLWYANLMGFTYRQQGRSDEAVALFAPLVAEPNPATEAAGPLLALILCEGERHDEARAIVDRFMASGRSYERDTSLLPNVGTLAVVAAELQDRDASVWLLEVLEPFAAWWSAWGAYGPIAPVSTLVARLRVTLGDHDGAESSFADAIVHCRANESRYFLADALLHQGLARSARGVEPHDRADESLREALELARAGGFHGIARRADRALAR
jgi:tetratricopeptide (TPR) repeat protein